MAKSQYILLGFLLFMLTVNAQQIPTGIPFQGIAKDYNGNPVNERKIYIQTNIIAGNINGKNIYTEEHETTTDAIGVFSILIGNGKRTQGTIRSLTEINWEDGPFYLGIQLAITPNAPVQNWQYQNNWINMGITSLGIVPYAYYALQTSGLQAKLNASDTANMLRNYVKVQVIKLLDSAISSKLSAKDTSVMLAPYTKSNSLVIDRVKDTIVIAQPVYNSTPTISFSGEYDSLKNKPNLFSGAYNDLTGKPNLFDGDYNTLINKPSLFSGDYNNLTNKPVLSLTGDITNNGNFTNLINSGVSSGTYGSGLAIPIISVDEKGRITSATTSAISPYSFPNKTSAQKNAMASISTGTVIWCSDCGTRGQMQVYNGYEWTDLTGAAALTNSISFGSISSSNISSSTVSITTTINTDGGASITSKGIVWNTSINPTITLSTKTNSGTGTGTFSESITGLSASTVYYVRTFATNANGTVYGNEISFTTTGVTPSLTTTAASSTTISSFTTGGTISNDGGNLVTYRGVCWSTSSNPTINDNRILSGTGTGTFTITLSNINLSTTYYVRSFATNSAGTAYGNERIVTTSSLVAGTTYLGGKIAYIFQSGDPGYIAGETHGFIIMNHAMGMQAAFGGYNPSTGYSYSGTSMNFGTGRNNTLLLYNMTGNNASKYVYNVSYDGYNDWYIPSYNEWIKIGPNWTSLGIPYGNYQCSSEVSRENGAFFTVYNSYGWISASLSNSGKTSLYDVIGIRNF
jgi:hypothetical protein